MDQPVFNHYNLFKTEELIKILDNHDSITYKKETFEIIQFILKKRGVEYIDLNLEKEGNTRTRKYVLCGMKFNNFEDWFYKNEKTISKILLFVIFLVIWILVFPINSNDKTNSSKHTSEITSNNSQLGFTHAHPGEKWVIYDANVSVMKMPEAPTNKGAYLNNLSTIIGNGDVVRVISTKRLYWKKVNLYNNGRVYASGWILSDTVKKAKKTSN
jgi:hypothetical protein